MIRQVNQEVIDAMNRKDIFIHAGKIARDSALGGALLCMHLALDGLEDSKTRKDFDEEYSPFVSNEAYYKNSDFEIGVINGVPTLKYGYVEITWHDNYQGDAEINVDLERYDFWKLLYDFFWNVYMRKG